MSASQPQRDETLDPTLEVELAELLDRYLTERQQGTAVSREQWLALHPQHADRLAAWLDSADLFGRTEEQAFDVQPPDRTPANCGMPDAIGDYEILSELGRGGMGVVYSAREKSLDRVVALKVMRFGIVDPKALERFQREAETAGALHHTNIVPVYATGREGDHSWYAMQKIDGQSLAGRIACAREDDQPVPLEEVLLVGIQAAEALHHAHQRDVVHRDVKPANLIVDPEQRVWLTDFGLARRLVDVGATMTGTMLGTPRYMSPEQADLRNTEVDHRSDIYSLGATLYELATGRPPFEGDDPLEMIGKIRHDEPERLTNLRPDLTRDLEVVLQKAMAKEPGRRYQTASALADDLRAIRDDHPIQARPLSVLEKAARWSRKHQGRLRTAATATVATAAGVALLLAALNRWNESRLGQFRLRSGGAPSVAYLHPLGESDLADDAVELAVPMQGFSKLPAGDYHATIATRGTWSRDVTVPITRGMPSDYRLSQQPSDQKEVSLDGALVVTLQGDRQPAILWQRDGQMRRITLDGRADWELDGRFVPTLVTDIDADNTADGDESRQPIDFAFTQQASDHRHGHRTLDDDSLFAGGVYALRTKIDLNGDGKGDTLVAATDRQALMAVNHQGDVLWSRAYSFGGLSEESVIADPSGRRRFSFPGVFGLRDVGDFDDDQISDVLATLAHVRGNAPTEVCLALLSGQTGRVIRSFKHQIKATDGTLWPVDGLFEVGRHQLRSHRGLTFGVDSTRRASRSRIYEFHVRQSTTGYPFRVALPSPPRFIHSRETDWAVCLSGDQCRRYDLRTGQEVTPAIQLPFMPARSPAIARAGDEVLLVFHSADQQVTPGVGSSGIQVVAYGIKGDKRWQRQLAEIDWGESIGRNQNDWPLVTDLNDDGIDEIVVPTHGPRYGQEIGVQLLGSTDGRPSWAASRVPQLYCSADPCISRVGVTADIDADGTRDLATASIAGPGSDTATLGATLKTGDAFVYVDWISGRTGQRLAWARHRLPVIGDRVSIAEIDALRTVATGNGTVEIDLVTGDNSTDVELESAVVRFRPGSVDPIAIALGLDGVPTPGDDLGGTRVYRRRGGPYGIGDDHVRLMETPDGRPERLGESEVISTWRTESGRNLIAAIGMDPVRLSVIDSETLHTVWVRQRRAGQNMRSVPVTVAGGQHCFVVQDQSGHEQPPELLDAETGEVLVELSDIAGGVIVAADFLPDQNGLLLVGDGRLSSPFGVERPDAFTLSVFSITTGRRRWSATFLARAPHFNYPSDFDDLRLADLNGDGVADVIGPDASANSSFSLTAWNGRDGQKLWKLDLHQEAQRSDYYVPFDLVRIDGQPHVAYWGRAEDEKDSRQLHLVDPRGHRLASHEILDTSDWLSIDRRYGFRALALAAHPTEPRIVVSTTGRGRPQCQVLDVGQRDFEVSASYSSEETIQGVWFHDLDGDLVPERFEATAQRPDDSSADAFQTLTVTCYRFDETDPLFCVAIDGDNSIRDFQWRNDSGHPVNWMELDSGRFVAIDWSTREILFDRQIAGREAFLFPRICNPETGEIAQPTRDGIALVSMPPSTSDSEAVVDAPLVIGPAQPDPRRVKRLLQGVAPAPSPSTWMLEMAKSALALGGLVVLPSAYLWRSWRRRRWSLAWILLAPVVAGTAIVLWQSRWIHQPSLLAQLLPGVGVWLTLATLAIAKRHRRDADGGNVRLMLSVGTPVVFAAMVGFAFVQSREPGFRYVVSWTDLAGVLLTSLMLVAQLYWMLRLPVAATRRLRQFFSPRAVAP
ncbi:serine/threonine protein kinase [Roseiconus nitratireducens]|uniref:non-specific serine/threonine protein kinase n=1 Tax=Roseiconus nitratireducens TaxID=2605748 RepID=A0A5M6CU47_9BACT|nr:serine/threonine-protein kinase [Roseiconus nitratireducens]KAA5538754.1 serine/threonine protein kinase [Roseiconus nitratireducens]